jgi:hypothetical protein
MELDTNASRYRQPIGCNGNLHFERPASSPALWTALGMLLSFSLFVLPAWGADVRGRITLSNGQPAANEQIMLGNKPIGRTDATGVYWLNLPPGTHVLVVRGQQFRVPVDPKGRRYDIKLR